MVTRCIIYKKNHGKSHVNLRTSWSLNRPRKPWCDATGVDFSSKKTVADHLSWTTKKTQDVSTEMAGFLKGWETGKWKKPSDKTYIFSSNMELKMLKATTTSWWLNQGCFFPSNITILTKPFWSYRNSACDSAASLPETKGLRSSKFVKAENKTRLLVQKGSGNTKERPKCQCCFFF